MAEDKSFIKHLEKIRQEFSSRKKDENFEYKDLSELKKELENAFGGKMDKIKNEFESIKSKLSKLEKNTEEEEIKNIMESLEKDFESLVEKHKQILEEDENKNKTKQSQLKNQNPTNMQKPKSPENLGNQVPSIDTGQSSSDTENLKLQKSQDTGQDTIDQDKFDIDSLDYENFDFGQLKDIPEKYHKKIALKLIETGKGDYVAENLDKFESLDHKKIAEKIIEVVEGRYVAQNLDKFIGLDHKEIAEKLIEVGEGFFVAFHLDKFSGLDLNKEIALKLIEAGGAEPLVHFIVKFKGLDKEVAEKLSEAGEEKFVNENPEIFGMQSGIKTKEDPFFDKWEDYSKGKLNVDESKGTLNEAVLIIDAFINKVLLKMNYYKIKSLRHLDEIIASKTDEQEKEKYVDLKNLYNNLADKIEVLGLDPSDEKELKKAKKDFKKKIKSFKSSKVKVAKTKQIKPQKESILKRMKDKITGSASEFAENQKETILQGRDRKNKHIADTIANNGALKGVLRLVRLKGWYDIIGRVAGVGSRSTIGKKFLGGRDVGFGEWDEQIKNKIKNKEIKKDLENSFDFLVKDFQKFFEMNTELNKEVTGKNKRELTDEETKGKHELRNKIKGLREKILNSPDLSNEEKEKFKQVLSEIIRQNREENQAEEDKRKKQIEKAVDAFVYNKISTMTLVSDVLNTALMHTGLFLFSGAVSGIRVSAQAREKAARKFRQENIFANFSDQEIKSERRKFIAKEMTIKAAIKTGHALSFGLAQKDNKKGFGGRILDFAGAFGKIAMAFGITTVAIGDTDVMGKLNKLIEDISEKGFVETGADNFVDHLVRLKNAPGQIWEWTKNATTSETLATGVAEQVAEAPETPEVEEVETPEEVPDTATDTQVEETTTGETASETSGTETDIEEAPADEQVAPETVEEAPTPETTEPISEYTIKKGDGLFNAINKFERDPEIREKILAALVSKKEGLELDNLTPKQENDLLREWRMDQAAKHGYSYDKISEHYKQILHPGAKVELTFDEDGNPVVNVGDENVTNLDSARTRELYSKPIKPEGEGMEFVPKKAPSEIFKNTEEIVKKANALQSKANALLKNVNLSAADSKALSDLNAEIDKGLGEYEHNLSSLKEADITKDADAVTINIGKTGFSNFIDSKEFEEFARDRYAQNIDNRGKLEKLEEMIKNFQDKAIAKQAVDSKLEGLDTADKNAKDILKKINKSLKDIKTPSDTPVGPAGLRGYDKGTVDSNMDSETDTEVSEKTAPAPAKTIEKEVKTSETTKTVSEKPTAGKTAKVMSSPEKDELMKKTGMTDAEADEEIFKYKLPKRREVLSALKKEAETGDKTAENLLKQMKDKKINIRNSAQNRSILYLKDKGYFAPEDVTKDTISTPVDSKQEVTPVEPRKVPGKAVNEAVAKDSGIAGAIKDSKVFEKQEIPNSDSAVPSDSDVNEQATSKNFGKGSSDKAIKVEEKMDTTPDEKSLDQKAPPTKDEIAAKNEAVAKDSGIAGALKDSKVFEEQEVPDSDSVTSSDTDMDEQATSKDFGKVSEDKAIEVEEKMDTTPNKKVFEEKTPTKEARETAEKVLNKKVATGSGIASADLDSPAFEKQEIPDSDSAVPSDSDVNEQATSKNFGKGSSDKAVEVDKKGINVDTEALDQGMPLKEVTYAKLDKLGSPEKIEAEVFKQIKDNSLLEKAKAFKAVKDNLASVVSNENEDLFEDIKNGDLKMNTAEDYIKIKNNIQLSNTSVTDPYLSESMRNRYMSDLVDEMEKNPGIESDNVFLNKMKEISKYRNEAEKYNYYIKELEKSGSDKYTIEGLKKIRDYYKDKASL